MHVLIVGGRRGERLAAARHHEETSPFHASARGGIDARTWPFIPPEHWPRGGSEPRLLRIDDIDRAFPNAQTTGTRLILTQSTYSLQALIDRLGAGVRIVATADRAALETNAPEAFHERGPWRLFTRIDLDGSDVVGGQEVVASGFSPPSVVESGFSRIHSQDPVASALADAFLESTSAVRLSRCRDLWQAHNESAMAALAFASACREAQDLEAARTALDAAAHLAPAWAAVPYESGKLWLGCEEMERARDDFARAAELMPSFSAAFSNLGATLGELDQPEAAVMAFEQALATDPRSFTILNNIGVVNRELGRLADSEVALARVVALNPAFVFGHYNLGHTRFLRGDYRGAQAAYEEGQRRDPSGNRRQGCRLALVRFANGDLEGADRDLWRHVDAAQPDEREDLLLEAYEIAQALAAAHPELPGGHAFVTRIANALTV